MMNNSIPKVKTAHVLLVNVDDRHAAMLRMAFKMYNSVMGMQKMEMPCGKKQKISIQMRL